MGSDIALGARPSPCELERALDYFPCWRAMYLRPRLRKREKWGANDSDDD